MLSAPQFGAKATGVRLQRIQASPNFRNGCFQNLIETPLGLSLSSMIRSSVDFFKGGPDREPTAPVSSVPLKPGRFAQSPAADIAVTWFGHSTVLIELDGYRLLIDPVLSGHASPFSTVGPRAFPGAQVLLATDVPRLDALILSHDHYDHLDYETIAIIKDKSDVIYAPLGVGAHLEAWGVAPERIIECDWWDSVTLGRLKLTAVPARHFSGRRLLDRNTTLWTGWALESAGRKILYGGDSGYFAGFKEIGARFGPFDLAMLECGAYSQYWPYIHMMPEETAQAGLDLKCHVLLPIHWGKFNLSLHSWTEPIERLTRAANQAGLPLLTPRIGETVSLDGALPQTAWWRSG